MGGGGGGCVPPFFFFFLLPQHPLVEQSFDCSRGPWSGKGVVDGSDCTFGSTTLDKKKWTRNQNLLVISRNQAA